MHTAVIYARFSPRPNAADCESISAQLAVCRQHCAAAGYQIIGEWADEAMSGSEVNRPSLWAAVGAVPKGGVLVVWKYDRLARDVLLAETIYRQVSKAGGRVECVDGPDFDDTPHGRFVRQILSAVAEYERELVRIRTSMAMRAYQASGRRMGGRPPYGTMIDPMDPKRLITHPDEQRVLECARAMNGAGSGYGDIARALNQQGMRNRKGGLFSRGQVRRMLHRSTS